MTLWATDNYEIQSQRGFYYPLRSAKCVHLYNFLDFLSHDFPSWTLFTVSPSHGCFLSRENLAINALLQKEFFYPRCPDFKE